MAEFLTFLIEHGYTVLFVWVALDQAGLPLPAVPLLLAAGALAGMGELNLSLVLLTCVLAAVPIDALWFWLGQRRGSRVLHLLCILSIEPDFCVRNTEEQFRKLGPLALVIAKFLPGLNILAPPMAGLTGMSAAVFLLLDTLGAIMYTLVFVGVGWFFHTELEMIAMRVAELGVLAGIIAAVLVTVYFGWKLLNRRIFLQSLNMRRLTPEALHDRLQGGDGVHIIDLRHDFDFNALPHLLPGAVRVAMESIDLHIPSIPPDRDIILCCT
ncbi:MAG: membrane protein DedA with SNARE-associated domain [Candidatus Azotimanducaceae bacterium]|jgi:membrane protein DedA with SNARE-associated domain